MLDVLQVQVTLLTLAAIYGRSTCGCSNSPQKGFAMPSAWSAGGGQGPNPALPESRISAHDVVRVDVARTASSFTALVGPCVPLALLLLCVVPEVASHGTGACLSLCLSAAQFWGETVDPWPAPLPLLLWRGVRVQD